MLFLVFFGGLSKRFAHDVLLGCRVAIHSDEGLNGGSALPLSLLVIMTVFPNRSSVRGTEA